MEIWKMVTMKDSDILVSSLGNVKCPEKKTTYTRTRLGKTATFTSTFKEKTLTPQVTKLGYLEVAAVHNGKRVRHSVHRLVGMAFVPGYAENLSINHINGIKTDNRPENLEWVSLSKNTLHAWETGLMDICGDKSPNAKLTSKRVAYIRKLLNQGVSAHTLAIVAGVSNSLIDLIRDGKRWADVKAATD